METSIGTELTTIFEEFSTTVVLSSNINSSQKPFSTAMSPVHHVSFDISCSMSSVFLPVLLAYVLTMLCLITFSSSAIFKKSSALKVSQTVIAGSCIINTPFLAILIVSPAIAMIVAALAAQPSILTVTLAEQSFNLVKIAFAANTSPPPLLIRTIISGTSPSAASS